MAMTPGPWAIAAERYIVVDPQRDGRIIVSLDSYNFLPEVRLANAKAIAALPDIIDAARAMVAAFPEIGTDDELNGGDAVERLGSLIPALAAALAKVEG